MIIIFHPPHQKHTIVGAQFLKLLLLGLTTPHTSITLFKLSLKKRLNKSRNAKEVRAATRFQNIIRNNNHSVKDIIIITEKKKIFLARAKPPLIFHNRKNLKTMTIKKK